MSLLLAPSSGWQMSAIPPLSGDQQTSGERAEIDARDPTQKSAHRSGCSTNRGSCGAIDAPKSSQVRANDAPLAVVARSDLPKIRC
jgi:hypothetical protein